MEAIDTIERAECRYRIERHWYIDGSDGEHDWEIVTTASDAAGAREAVETMADPKSFDVYRVRVEIKLPKRGWEADDSFFEYENGQWCQYD